MTIESTIRKSGPFTSDGVVLTFPFEFQVLSSEDIRVIATDLLEVERVLPPEDYTIELNLEQEQNPGGSIILQDPLPEGELVTLTTDVEATQLVKITNLGGFYPRLISDALNKLTVLVQQLQEKSARAVVVDISSTITPSELIDDLKEASSAAQQAASSTNQDKLAAEQAAEGAETSRQAAEEIAATIEPQQILKEAFIYSVAGGFFNSSTSTANSKVLTKQGDFEVPEASLLQGAIFEFYNSIPNTGPVTCTIAEAGIPPVPVVDQSGNPLTSGALQTGNVRVQYDHQNGRFLFLPFASKGLVGFDTSGIFVAPVSLIYVTLIGGGGGGAGTLTNATYAGGGGGAGGISLKRPVPVTLGASYQVTIGQGGAGGLGTNQGGDFTTSNGQAGGITSFGSLLSVSGGGGGQCQANSGAGGAPGSVVFSSYGAAGDILTNPSSICASGGGNIFASATLASYIGRNGTFYGGGGTGGSPNGGSGGNGARSLVIIEW